MAIFLVRRSEPRAAARLQACWQERMQSKDGRHRRNCTPEVDEYMAACQRNRSNLECIDRLGKLIGPRAGAP